MNANSATAILLAMLATAAAAEPPDDTDALQTAIDNAWRAGGGTVEVAPGEHLVRGLLLRSNVTLHLQAGAVLVGSRQADDYEVLKRETLQPELAAIAPWRWANAVIRASGIENASVIGEEGSAIDGRNCYDPQGEQKFRGPHGISAYHATNIVCRGYEVRNAGNWAHAFFDCRDLVFEDLRVRAGHDGIHVRSCDNVRILGCSLVCGDDCVAGCFNRDVVVRDCEFNTACSAFRFGGTRVVIERCRAWGPGRYPLRCSLPEDVLKAGGDGDGLGRRNMLSFFTYFAVDGSPKREMQGRIEVRDCAVEGVDRFFHFNLSGNDGWQKAYPLSSISFERVTAKGLRRPLCAFGHPEVTATLSFSDCAFEFAEPVSELIRGGNVRSLTLENVAATGVEGPAFRIWTAAPKTTFAGLSGVAPEVVREEGPFTAERF